jgi:hypothetical protein
LHNKNFTRAINLNNSNLSVFENLNITNNNGAYAGFFMNASNSNNLTNLTFSYNNASDNAGLFMRMSSNIRVINTSYTFCNITKSSNINSGALVGLYYSNNSYFENIQASENTVKTESSILGGGIIGLMGAARNLFNTIDISSVNISSARIQGGGIIGIYQYSQYNNWSSTSIYDSHVSTTDYVWGGSGLGFGSFSSNNILSGINCVNLTADISTYMAGGGCIGLDWSASHSAMEDIFIENLTLRVSDYIFGGGAIGFNSASDNNLSNIYAAGINLTTQYIYGGAIVGLSTFADGNIIDNMTLDNNLIAASHEYGLVGINRDSDENLIRNAVVNDSNSLLFYLSNYNSQGVHNNIIENLLISNSASNAIVIAHIDSTNNILRNITVQNSTLAAINLTNARNTDLINITFINTPWDVYAYNASITEYDMDDFSLEIANATGSIKFTNLSLNASGSNLSQVIRLSNNSAFINTSLDPGFNTTANITFTNIGWTTPDHG